ncbi:MAG TPA: DUF420 domain-containing protein [Lacunisphaera sp.]|nr:DUF420 domain-containing protein [Lacunisphaera sp.]
MTFNDIPALNACLNGLATVLIVLGFAQIKAAQRATDPAIKSSRIQTHRRLMLTAGVVSALFLVGYIAHKVLKGMNRGAGEALHSHLGADGFVLIFYRSMLASHILLAMAIAYLVPRTFLLAINGNYERHKRWAKFTYPIWLYVSVTGVLVYLFLYQWWPAVPAE